MLAGDSRPPESPWLTSVPDPAGPSAVAVLAGCNRPRGRAVVAYDLPLSGHQVVVTERADRHVLELFDSEQSLVAVVSNSVLDPSVVRGSWRGVHQGRPWSLLVGRGGEEPVSVEFRTGGLRLHRHRYDVASSRIGSFWVVEAAVAATHATVTMAGRPAGEVSLRLARQLRPAG